MQRITYTNADGLVRNGKEPEFKEQADEIKPNIIGIVKPKLNKDVKSHVVFLEGYKKKRKESKGGRISPNDGQNQTILRHNGKQWTS